MCACVCVCANVCVTTFSAIPPRVASRARARALVPLHTRDPLQSVILRELKSEYGGITKPAWKGYQCPIIKREQFAIKASQICVPALAIHQRERERERERES